MQRTPNTALLASLLYAFSGYSIYNIFFNHFHEAIIVFPLLLAALDEYMYTKRRGIFALHGRRRVHRELLFLRRTW